MQLNNTIEMSFNEDSAIIHYYATGAGQWGKPLGVYLAPGDLYKICNAFHDYEGILRNMTEIIPEDERTGSVLMWGVYADQLNKIRGKIEKALGYNVEEAHRKCIVHRSKKPAKDDGIGEEAMVMAIRKARDEAAAKERKILEEEQSKKSEKKKKLKQEKEPEQSDQMNIFDVIGEVKE